MKKLLFALGVALWLCAPAHAQVVSAYTVSACGAQSNPAGQSFPLTMDLKGNLCESPSNTSAAPLYETPVVNGGPVTNANPLPVNASVAVTGFAPASVGTPIGVTTGGVTGTLPAGTVVVASNAGATNTAYCALGASSTTAQQPIPPGGWFAFTVGAATQLTCITSTSTTTVNMVGGSGLPTGSGGGGSVASLSNYALETGGNLATIAANTGAAIPVGPNIFGKVGIDQTTPGTTNNVTISPLPAAARHFPGCTVGASSGSCLAASTAVNFLQIQNTSASASIACAFGGSAVLNSSTSVQLSAGQSASWGPHTGGVPTGQMNCIASAGSTPLYVEWN